LSFRGAKDLQMSRSAPQSIDAKQRQQALAGWDNEGGAGPCGPLEAVRLLGDDLPLPEMGRAELLALHIRVIALENLLIAVLANGTEEQRDVSRSMAGYIAPRAGATPHPITTLASAHMMDLVDRADRFRPEADSGEVR
jgi:hypothetical protein